MDLSAPKRFYFPTRLEENIVVNENGKEVHYKVEFFNLRVDDKSVRGGARVTRYEQRKILGWMFLKKIWRFVSCPWGHDFMISGGSFCNNRSSGYRSELKKKVTKGCVVFSDDFLEKLFHSLDEKVMAAFKKI